MTTINVTITTRTPFNVSVSPRTPIQASLTKATPINATVTKATPLNASVSPSTPIRVSITATARILQLTWIEFLTNWTSKPQQVATIAAGRVFDHPRGVSTFYRLVPVPYDPTQDTFYSAFDGTNLTGPIVSRA